MDFTMVLLILVKECDHFEAEIASQIVTVLGAFPDESSADDFRLGYAHSCSHGDVLCIVSLDFIYGAAKHDVLVVSIEGANDGKN